MTKAETFKHLERLVQLAMELGQAFERAKRSNSPSKAGQGRARAWAAYYRLKSMVREKQRELAGLEPMRELKEEVLFV